ncbi:MAG: dTDP-4-dehydrorhamnose 3,5-epimerase [Cyclobacteriaceae bacterium]
MKLIETPLKECYIIESNKFGDDRGFFLESFNKKRFLDHGIDFEVKQVNFAKSSKNVLRGLHFQKEPFDQSKLVGVINGSVLDVVVDFREKSPTYLQYFKYRIDKPNHYLLIPRGFAHGYYTFEDDTIFHYAVDNFYSAESEGGLRYNDPVLNIDWGLKEEPIVSEKDLKQPLIKI